MAQLHAALGATRARRAGKETHISSCEPKDSHRQSTCPSGCGRIAVVVEDCVSAVIVGSDVYVGVAVLGTSLSDIHKRYLSQFSSAVIALDPDALPKAMEFFKDLKSTVNDVRVLRLTDDLKYKHPNDIEKLTAIGEQINGNSINS